LHDRTPGETAEVALRAADEAVAGVVDGIRRQVRQRAVACLLGDSQYRVGAEMCRRLSFTEDMIFDLVAETAEINQDDGYMAFEDAFALDQRLLDRLESSEEA
jgi:hypothetical protein